jgi:hypothetical protein
MNSLAHFISQTSGGVPSGRCHFHGRRASLGQCLRSTHLLSGPTTASRDVTGMGNLGTATSEIHFQFRLSMDTPIMLSEVAAKTTSSKRLRSMIFHIICRRSSLPTVITRMCHPAANPDLVSMYGGINKSLPWTAVEDLGIHRIHLFITQKEVNKYCKYKIVFSSLSLNNSSSCADGHVRLIFCHFP